MAYTPPPFAPQHVIPAYPGFFTLFLVDGDTVARTPVVGFAVDSAGCTLPIGAQGLIDDYQAIQNPDGTVEDFDQVWESAEAFLSGVVARSQTHRDVGVIRDSSQPRLQSAQGHK
ncbi:MAG: hypothetical protein EPN31_13870 [Castellaniella sp.]|uniref:hypothetical protein n=1 Tax=Castellaniella sp. TaxID=1955812 RepID=UPI0012186325|nr:hypothetical protein [Castellaniella sp.]TAN26007.1 MAG: hypothetical protein EPN31_13870 [Castellaniella sp.]